MRVIFMGTPDFAVASLQALIAHHQVLAVVTQPDKRKGRGKAIIYSPVKEEALKAGIPVLQPEKVRDEDFIRQLEELEPEVIVVAAFGQILPEKILDMPPFGCLNIHASLLPAYRGAAPIQWAVINGEKETGLTIMYMEKGLDTGDMIEKEVVPVDPKETGESLHDKLAEKSGPLILRVLDEISAGRAKRTRQDDSASSYAPMLSKKTGHIDWSKDAASIERLVRGLNSWPSAYTFFKGKTLKIWDCDVEEANDPERVREGTVTEVARNSFTVGTGRGLLVVKEVQLQGKRRMPVRDFLLGHNLEPGYIFDQE